MDCGRNESEGNTTPPLHSASSPGLDWTDQEELRNVDSGLLLFHLGCGTSPQYIPNQPTQTVNPRGAMLRQILLNSTDTPDFDLVVMAQSATHAPGSMNASHDTSVRLAALLRPTTGRGGGLREGEFQKPDLATYIVMCIVLFLLVLLIVFFINCQLRNSFFASMPYDRSLREARTSYK